MSGNGISWAICKSAPRCRQITTPAPHHSVFTGRMPFLPPNQQYQSTEGNNNCLPPRELLPRFKKIIIKIIIIIKFQHCLWIAIYVGSKTDTVLLNNKQINPKHFIRCVIECSQFTDSWVSAVVMWWWCRAHRWVIGAEWDDTQAVLQCGAGYVCVV